MSDPMIVAGSATDSIEKPMAMAPLKKLASIGQSQGLLSSLLAFMVNDENTHANLISSGKQARDEFVEAERSGALAKEQLLPTAKTIQKPVLRIKTAPPPRLKRSSFPNSSFSGGSSPHSGTFASRPPSPTTKDDGWDSVPQDESIKPVKILASLGAFVKQKPILFGGRVLCQIKKNTVVRPTHKTTIDEVAWVRISCGWVCQYDSDGSHAYEETADDEEAAFSYTEAQNRRRLASAICALLTRSHSLPTARRMSKAVLRHACGKTHSTLNCPNLTIDELLNALNGAVALKRNELFEFIKIGASLTSDPPQSVIMISEELEQIIQLRPTKWVTQELNVITTTEVERRNNKFIMAAARGNWREFNKCIAQGQEISVMHSMMNYTALHAACEFGTLDIVAALCKMGMSINVRDCRGGQSPLHYAAAAGKFDVAHLLLSCGADRSVVCNRGQQPFELAAEEGHVDVAELLKYRPPEIVHFVTLRCTETSISVAWQAPPFDPRLHSTVHQYVLDWTPIEEALIDPQYVAAAGLAAADHQPREAKTIRLEVPCATTVSTLHGVIPASSYSCVVRSQSKAGLSDPSNQLIAFTLSAPPDTPPSVEILKVTLNGLMLSWLPPKRENGLKIFLYEIEIIDYQKLQGMRRDEVSVAIAEGAETEGAEGGEEGEGGDGGGVSHRSLRADQSSEGLPRQALSGAGKGGGVASNPQRNGNQEPGGDEDNGAIATVTGTAADTDTASGTGVTHTVNTATTTTGANSMWHRVIKHHNVNTRSKLVMGLEPGRLFCCRVRACNEAGFSDWSTWNRPVAPHAGVQASSEVDYLGAHSSAHRTAAELLSDGTAAAPSTAAATAITATAPGTGTDKGGIPGAHLTPNTDRPAVPLSSISLSWFAPVLALTRRVTGYEIQQCSLIGPLRKNVINEDPLTAYDKRTVQFDKETGEEFVTVQSGVRDNYAIITGLRGGGKYLFRVRPQVDGVWYSWEVSVLSEVVLIPPAAPDACVDVAPATVEDKEVEEVTDESLLSESEASENAGLARRAGRGVERLDVTHDSVVVRWTNGLPNGVAVVEYEVFAAKISGHRSAMVELSATLGTNVQGEGAHATTTTIDTATAAATTHSDATHPSTDPSAPPASSHSSDLQEDHLEWLNITRQGEPLGPQAFRARGLARGTSYVFCVRQRNDVGWSGFSAPSCIVTTSSVLPPTRPEVVLANSVDAVLQWVQEGQQTFLEHQLQLATLSPIQGVGGAGQVQGDEVTWRPFSSRQLVGEQVIASGAAAVSASGNSTAVTATGEANTSTPAHAHTSTPAHTPSYTPAHTTASTVRGGLAVNLAQVLVLQLSPGSVYIARVRVRSVVGWSAWSLPTQPFRTAPAP